MLFRSGAAQAVRLSLVYPADATPGHLLSVISEGQLATLLRQEQRRIPVQPTRRPPPPLEPPPAVSQSGSPGQRIRTASSQAPLRKGAGNPSRSLPDQLQGARANQGRRTSPQPLRPPRQLGSNTYSRPLRPPQGLLQPSRRPGRPELLMLPSRRLSRWPGDGDPPRDSTLVDRYRQAVEAQERIMRRWSP